jgi:hypothetical protein
VTVIGVDRVGTGRAADQVVTTTGDHTPRRLRRVVLGFDAPVAGRSSSRPKGPHVTSPVMVG